MNFEKHNLIILGSGPAGYTAAIYAARANLSPTLISGPQPGGQLTITTDVDNWPGDADGVQGPELMERMKRQAERFETNIISDTITATQLEDGKIELTGEKATYEASALIIATGASAKYLGIASEQAFMGRGVSACATCDGFFYKDQVVTVVGGGNTAVEEALYLSNIAKKVHLVHRRDTLRAEKILQKKLSEKVKAGIIETHWHYETDEIIGDQMGVTGIQIKNTQDRSIQTIDCQGVFIAIGHTPNTKIFEGQLEMDNGYIQIKSGQQQGSTQTSVPGVFAAGDVTDQVYRQAVTSAGFGCMSALDAEKYLDEK